MADLDADAKLKPIKYYPFSGDPFIINYLYGEGSLDCSALKDPDQAGLGVVLSAVIVAIATMILSWIAFYLDPKKTGRKVTEKAILSLADQQLITGLALLISAHVNRHRYTLYKEDKDDYQDAHFILVIYQSCLSISSFLSGILIQEKPLKKPVITIIRAVVTASYALFILWTVGESYHAFDPIMYLWLGRPRPDENEIFSWRIISLRRRWSMVGLALLFPISAISLSQSPGPNGRLTIACALAWQSFYVIVFAVLVLKQKFAHPPPVTDDASEAGIKRWCGLNNPGDNEWVFGQTVAVVMLLLPLMTTIEAYYDTTEASKQQSGKAKTPETQPENPNSLADIRDSQDEAGG